MHTNNVYCDSPILLLLLLLLILICIQHIHVNMLMNIGVCDINMCDVLRV